MKHQYRRIGILILILSMAGCAYMRAGDGPNPELSAQYLANAQTLEHAGDLPGAMEKYKLALTADPGNTAAAEGRQRVGQRMAKIADDRYRLGMKYYNQGKYALARNEFLTALKYQPDHPGASKMLVSREPENAASYIFHVVKPGESLSVIAKKYYGDYKKYNLIAEFNNIQDATMVKPGQRIMVPEINGQRLTGVGATLDDASTYVIHKLQPGESISRLAKIYYGDYRKFHIIAQFNGMDDATKVTVGQRIKVPRVAGLPFNLPSKDTEPDLAQEPQKVEAIPEQPPEPAEDSEPLAQAPKPLAEVVEEPQPAADDEQVFAYRDSGIELFNQGKYEDAVFELNKAVEAAPEDQITRSYLAKAYLETGKALFTEDDFKAAEEAFESALHYNPDCTECQAMIDRSKIGPLLQHRTKGVAYFNKSQYAQAISELEAFLQIQPQDNEARHYLSKSHFELAMADFTEGRFEEARSGFESALEIDEKCEKCTEYIKRSVDSLKASHYNRGIVFYSKEQLPEAIREWQIVYDTDPGYKDVDQNLKKAKSLLEKLEKIKNTRK